MLARLFDRAFAPSLLYFQLAGSSVRGLLYCYKIRAQRVPREKTSKKGLND
jgi:hypothetical protein